MVSDDESGDFENFLTQCPECGGTHIIEDYDHGELICEKCGLVPGRRCPTFASAGRSALAVRFRRNFRHKVGSSVVAYRHDEGG